MAGAYCRFCDRRCFVWRRVRVGGQVIFSGHLATCADGKAHDRAKLGTDADSPAAENPLQVLTRRDVVLNDAPEDVP